MRTFQDYVSEAQQKNDIHSLSKLAQMIGISKNSMSVMYKKTAVEAAGGYQDWFWNEDYYLWIRMWLNEAVFGNTFMMKTRKNHGKECKEKT